MNDKKRFGILAPHYSCVFLSALVLIAPAILFPFGLSLILALLLRPLAVSIQMVIEKILCSI